MKIRDCLGIVAGLVALLVLPGCSTTQGQAPKLKDAHGNLAAYWEEAAKSVGISPDEGQLNEWALSYDEEGAVTRLRLVVYVERGVGRSDQYTILQDSTGIPTWNRTRLAYAPQQQVATIPAKRLFSELDAVGYRHLEQELEIAPPIDSWVRTHSGTITYGHAVDTHIIKGGRTFPAGPEGVTMQGAHGTLQLQPAAPAGARSTVTPSRSGRSPRVYLVPEAGCSPNSVNMAEVASRWLCRGLP